MSEKSYSKEEVDKILKDALKKQLKEQGRVSEDDLIKAAKEMGIDEGVVREQLKEKEAAQLQKETSFQGKQAFFIHLIVFVIANLIFLKNGFRFPGPPMMKMFPFFPWIIFLVMHGLAVFTRMKLPFCGGNCHR